MLRLIIHVPLLWYNAAADETMLAKASIPPDQSALPAAALKPAAAAGIMQAKTSSKLIESFILFSRELLFIQAHQMKWVKFWLDVQQTLVDC